jgi:hypothetical protein
MKCGFCEGSGTVDSGGVEPCGRWISIPCEWCNGTGVEMSEQAKDLWWLEFAKLAKTLGCLASASKGGNEHVFEKAEIVMRHWHQSVEVAKRCK